MSLFVRDFDRTVTLVTPPAEEPLTLAQAKAHLREVQTDEDPLISRLIVAARRFLETKTQRQFVTATHLVQFDGFPDERRIFDDAWYSSEFRRTRRERDEIFVPFPPLQSVDSLKYIATEGTLTTLGAANYQVDGSREPGRVVPAFGFDWPSTRDEINVVRIQFVAGYGGADDVPETLKQAMLLLVAHWFEHREAAIEPVVPQMLEMALNSLLWSERMVQFN